MNFQERSKIMITCQRHLSDALAGEVEGLGFEIEGKFLTGVTFTGTLEDCIRLNLNLRTASLVLFQIRQLDAEDADQLYVRSKRIPWDELISMDHQLSITSNVYNPTIDNNMFANLRLKDAIVDRIRDKKDARPETGSDMDGTVIYLYWKNTTAEIYYNTSGTSIARHGYRRIPGTAPMLESLAAAAIMSTRWETSRSFVNPMCGSGTLAIEAALMAKNVPPSEFREWYAFMAIPGYDESYYQNEMKTIRSAYRKGPKAPIIASDISERAIINSQKNAEAAGVLDWIDFQVCDFRETTVPNHDKGIVFLNPEYGERLGTDVVLSETYEEIGNFFKQKCAGYWGYVFTGNLDLAKKVGLRPKSKKVFFNSKIECRLLEYELYDGSRKSKKS